MKRGFTLIELLIVIAIISILMTVTMKFWSNRINDLGYQAGKEQFSTAYDKLYAQATTSNYHNTTRYELLHLTLASGANPLAFAYDDGTNEYATLSTPATISWLLLDDTIRDEVRLTLRPYTLWCDITSSTDEWLYTWSTVRFSLLVKGQKHYCFSIQNDTCKLIEHTCE